MKKYSSRCIFCGVSLKSNEDDEHILPAFIGGRLKSKEIVCTNCNAEFGSSIDATFSKDTELFRIFLDIKNRDGESPRPIRHKTADGKRVNVSSDGGIFWADDPLQYRYHEGGEIDISILAKNETEKAKNIARAAQKFGLSEDNVKKGGEEDWFLPSLGRFNANFPTIDTRRSILKSLLELWAIKVGNEHLLSGCYKTARDSVLSSKNYANDNIIWLGLESRAPEPISKLQIKFGPFYNLLYVESDPDGAVFGHFRLLNWYGVTALLAESGGVPSKRIALISNPKRPADWSKNIASEIDIDIKWLKTPVCNLSEVQRSGSRIAENIERRALIKRFETLITSAMQQAGVLVDDGYPNC